MTRRRTIIAAALTAGVVAAAAVAAASSGGGGGTTLAAGPTTEVATRDLVTTLTETGTVERVEERTISYAAPNRPPAVAESPVAPSAGSTTPAGATTGQRPSDAVPTTTTTAPATTTTTAPATETPAPSTEGPPAEPGPTTTTTAPAAAPQAPAPTTTTTTAPPATTTTTTTPVTSAAAGDEDDEEAATLTYLAPVGETAGRGSVLYKVDDEPVAALFGTIPAWRDLEQGVDAGADVRQLEENLVALGYGSGITVDEQFTSSTAAAVKKWEKDLGRSDPDSKVAVGEVVPLSGAGDVLGHEAVVGEALEGGEPVLTIGSEQQVLVATIDAADTGAWPAGTAVQLTWADGSTSEATVEGTGRDTTDGTVELTIALGEADRDRPRGAEADIEVVDARRNGALAVPVSAIVAAPNGDRAVRVPAGTTADRVVPVRTGIVSGGWIEIVEGLTAGTLVRLPG